MSEWTFSGIDSLFNHVAQLRSVASEFLEGNTAYGSSVYSNLRGSWTDVRSFTSVFDARRKRLYLCDRHSSIRRTISSKRLMTLSFQEGLLQ
jgi:hypothetical protein